MEAVRVVVMGVSGCGKSTIGSALAERLDVPFLEGDSLHPPRNIELMRSGVALTDDDRRDWLDAIAARLQAIPHDASLVISCSALKRNYRDRLRQACPDLLFVHLHGTRNTIAKRMALRNHLYMPTTLLTSQLDTLEVPQADESALTLDIETPAPSLVRCIIQHLQEHHA